MDIKNIAIFENERIDKINENLVLIQRIGGLTFGTDAYLLSAFVKKCRTCADFGTGTGVASLLCLTKDRAEKMYSFEIQENFACLAKRNAEINGLSERMTVINKDIREISQKDTDGCVDAAISNPPYMPAFGGFDAKNEEMNIARRELNGGIYDFCTSASKILKHGGSFYTVWRADRLCDLICALRAADLEPKRMVTVYPDTKSKPSLVLLQSKKGASPQLIQSKPLIIYKNGTRDYTDEMNEIYESFTLEHLF